MSMYEIGINNPHFTGHCPWKRRNSSFVPCKDAGVTVWWTLCVCLEWGLGVRYSEDIHNHKPYAYAKMHPLFSVVPLLNLEQSLSLNVTGYLNWGGGVISRPLNEDDRPRCGLGVTQSHVKYCQNGFEFSATIYWRVNCCCPYWHQGYLPIISQHSSASIVPVCPCPHQLTMEKNNSA